MNCVSGECRFFLRKPAVLTRGLQSLCRLVANAQLPYPSDLQKQLWENTSTLTRRQIDNFLINARKRRKRVTDTSYHSHMEVAVADPYGGLAELLSSESNRVM